MTSIYIHIPFCKQKCTYCNFHFSTSMKFVDEIVDAIILEIEHKKKIFSSNNIYTIYLGGGTPSILNNNQLLKIINKIYDSFNCSNIVEFTIEVNPDDVKEENIIFYKSLGINRISLGIQSFDDNTLKWMNRSHNSNQSIKSLEILRNNNIENLSIDLIYGVPNRNINMLGNDLEIIRQFGINHISTYCLTVENKTSLKYQIKNNFIKLPSDKQSNLEYSIINEYLVDNDNFVNYEISNFAKASYESKHNISYWTQVKYIGIGPSAHSYIDKKRYWNIDNNLKYIKSLLNNTSYYQMETLSQKDLYNEYIFTRMRTIKGIMSKDLSKLFGENYSKYFEKNIFKFVDSKDVFKINNSYILSQKGKNISDYISSELFFVD